MKSPDSSAELNLFFRKVGLRIYSATFECLFYHSSNKRIKSRCREPDQSAIYLFWGTWLQHRPQFIIGNDFHLLYNSPKRSKPSAAGVSAIIMIDGVSVDKGWLNPSELFPLPLLSNCNVRGLQKDATVYFFYDQHFSAKKCKNENGETCPLWTEIKTWEDMKCTIKKIIWTIWTFFATF